MSRNLYRVLRDLIPEPPLLVGTIASNNNGVATITMPGGGTLTARGSGTVGTKVYVRDGAIEGTAPSLTLEIIVV